MAYILQIAILGEQIGKGQFSQVFRAWDGDIKKYANSNFFEYFFSIQILLCHVFKFLRNKYNKKKQISSTKVIISNTLNFIEHIKSHKLYYIYRNVAIKIFRKTKGTSINIQRAMEQLILKRIDIHDIDGESCCIHMIKQTEYKGYSTTTFPLYGPTLNQVIQDNKKRQLPSYFRRDVIVQLCNACQFLHNIGIVHTDIKPENMIFINHETKKITAPDGKSMTVPANTKMKLIDFGSASMISENLPHHRHLIQTRHYRSPEVLLKLNWNEKADIWSIGCIIVELILGDVLFWVMDKNQIENCGYPVAIKSRDKCEGDIDHLAQIQDVLSTKVPKEMIAAVELQMKDKNKVLFDDGIINAANAKYMSQNLPNLKQFFQNVNYKEKNVLYNLVWNAMKWNPDDRASAYQLLQHEYFQMNVYDIYDKNVADILTIPRRVGDLTRDSTPGLLN